MPTPAEGDRRRIRTYTGALREVAPSDGRELSAISHSLTETLAGSMYHMTEAQREQLLYALRLFDNYVFGRGLSTNLRSPEMIIRAINGANALLSPEPFHPIEAQAMVDALDERYSGLKQTPNLPKP
jgi:hypothetical protein